MRNGVCSKCGHNDVRVGVGETEMLGQRSKGILGVTTNNLYLRTNFDVYICLYCGYVELALSDIDILGEIARKWPRVEQSPPGQQPG